MTSKDQNKKTNVNHKKIFGALESVDIEQSKFVSKINSQKEIKLEDTMPFPSRNVRENKVNYGKGFDYVYGTKPVSDQEDKNPFASALKKIKPSAETLSWLKSEVVEAKNVNELHKVIDKVLASGARLNACNDGEWSFNYYCSPYEKTKRRKTYTNC
ncbi:hypothetical protein wScaTNS_04080 [Wolbachia pipientis]